jgi:hypothetical protein
MTATPASGSAELAPSDVTEINLRRYRLTSDLHRRVKLCYEYQTPVDIDWDNGDGTTRPGPRAGNWTDAPGSGIADTRQRMRRMFPGARLIETWK